MFPSYAGGWDVLGLGLCAPDLGSRISDLGSQIGLEWLKPWLKPYDAASCARDLLARTTRTGSALRLRRELPCMPPVVQIFACSTRRPHQAEGLFCIWCGEVRT